MHTTAVGAPQRGAAPGAAPPAQSCPAPGRAMTRAERRRFVHMPIVLKRVLARRRISQLELARHLVQAGGRRAGQPFSDSAISLMLNHGDWPGATPAAELRDQIERFLREKGVPEEEIEVAWRVDEEPPVTRRGRFPSERPRKRRRARNACKPGRATAPYEGPQLPEADMLTEPARRHFKLFRDPFVDDVQGPDDVFLAEEQHYVREALYQTARFGGFLAVIGESGAGKTTLRRDLLDRIRREDLPITPIQPRIIDKGRLTAGAICDAIVGDVSQERPRATLEHKARQVERLLTGSSRAGNSHVLIIEEAHDLAVPTLKYLKRFWELEDGFRKLLAIILIGQPELAAKLDERQNWAAREVIRRCEIVVLKPLNGDLEAYLKLKFGRLNRELDAIFEPDAFDAIRKRLTRHVRGSDKPESMHFPLVVNNLVVKALNLAAELGVERITADVVREV